MTYETMLEELLEDLTKELSVSDANFNQDLLSVKIASAIREVKKARRYPSYYTEEQIWADMYDFYTNCHAIAHNDYNKIGIDFEDSHNENSVSASFTERSKLFAGILPLAK